MLPHSGQLRRVACSVTCLSFTMEVVLQCLVCWGRGAALLLKLPSGSLVPMVEKADPFWEVQVVRKIQMHCVLRQCLSRSFASQSDEHAHLCAASKDL